MKKPIELPEMIELICTRAPEPVGQILRGYIEFLIIQGSAFKDQRDTAISALITFKTELSELIPDKADLATSTAAAIEALKKAMEKS